MGPRKKSPAADNERPRSRGQPLPLHRKIEPANPPVQGTPAPTKAPVPKEPGKAESADLADLLVELLQGRTAEEALAVLALRRPLEDKWGTDEFREALRDLAQQYVSQNIGSLNRSSKAWLALHAFAELGGDSEAPKQDPVLTLLDAPSPREVAPVLSQGRQPLKEVLTTENLQTNRGIVTGLFRPKEKLDEAPASRLVPSPGAVGRFPGQASASGQGLGAFRPYHAGAYTDPGPPALDEASKALQTIAKAMAAKDEPTAQDRGKLAAIGKTEERIMFLARGCDTLSVHLGEATVGKELYHALRSLATQNRPLLREIGFPVNINNRIAFGIASLSLGGKGNLPEYCLSAADFPQTSEEEFDLFNPPSDNKLERRGRNPTSLSGWYRNAIRQAWALACTLGAEYYSSWEGAAAQLLKLGEEFAHAWPLQSVIGVWEELWARFVEELRSIDRQARREMQDENPSFDRLRFFATSPGSNGEPWLRLPQTFDLQASEEYFQTDIVPRQQRLLDRACWNMAFRKPALHGGRAGGEDEKRASPAGASRAGGGKGSGNSAPSSDTGQLLGSPLTSKEVSRSMDHRPKDKAGKYLCWDHFSHRKCPKGKECPHSHSGATPKWDGVCRCSCFDEAGIPPVQS